MSTKKTYLGKVVHQYETIEELYECVNKDVASFTDEVNAILDQFDPYNPYDMGVLKVLFARTLASLSIGLESEYPDFEDQVVELSHALLDEQRAAYQKLVESGKVDAYNKALQQRRIHRLAETVHTVPVPLCEKSV